MFRNTNIPESSISVQDLQGLSKLRDLVKHLNPFASCCKFIQQILFVRLLILNQVQVSARQILIIAILWAGAGSSNLRPNPSLRKRWGFSHCVKWSCVLSKKCVDQISPENTYSQAYGLYHSCVRLQNELIFFVVFSIFFQVFFLS